MAKKDRYASAVEILLAVISAVSLAAWAFEEAVGIMPGILPDIGVHPGTASAISLALDACVLGIGLACLSVRSRPSGTPSPLVEILSSVPVIVLSSAPMLYAYLEGREAMVPAVLFAARSLRILRLYRVFPGSNAVLLAALAICETLRTLAGQALPDTSEYAAALRLLLLPEAMLLLASALLGSSVSLRRRVPRGARRAERDARRAEREAQVGREELAGLLGKKELW